MPITRQQLERMFPSGNAEWVETLYQIGPRLAEHYRWTDHDWRHAMGQVWAETSGLSLRSMRENMRFTTAERIKAVYSYRLRLALQRDRALAREHGTVDGLARFLVGKPDLLADIVYGGREGTPVGQGHRYIGRGVTQITHLNNYLAIYAEILTQPGGAECPNLEDAPEALERADWGVRALFADWKIKGLSRWANDEDVENVSSVLNTGAPGKVKLVNGLAERKRGTARAVGIWPLDTPIFGSRPARAPDVIASQEETPPLRRGDEGPAVGKLQGMLECLGYHLGDMDQCFGELTERAVVAAQHEHGIPATGVADKRTIEALERSDKKPLPRAEMTERDLAERGSRTYEQAKGLTIWGRAMKWLGFPTGTAGIAETVSPGSVTQFVSAAPKLADSLTSPGMLRLYAIGFGIGLLVIGWRLTSGGKAIIGYRLEDAQTGKHIGR